MNFSIVRRSIAVPSLTTCTLPGNYGYIRLVTLGANDLPAELKEAISKLNSTRGLIIDVRGNPGGLLANAVDIADLFVSSGKICSTTSREGIVNYDAKGSCIYKKPIALLVDSDTSSGAEILAAALQDLGHAEVVGTKTAGEGLGQVVIPVDDDHTLHLALFQQLTSSGQPINRLGVTPSYLSAISPPEQLMGIGPWWTCNDKHFSAPGGGHDVQLLKAIRVLDKATGAASASQEQQDDDNKIKQEILATLKPLAPSASPPLTGPERPIGDKWALVIGISKFKNPEIDLKFPAKDAKDFAGYLVSNANFAADHVKVLTDEQATREAILDSLADHWLPRLAKKDDLVVIYFSTHGSASDMDIGGVNYVVAHDTNPESLLATGIAMEDLVRIIKKRIESDRVLVILDACHSGGASADAKDLSRPGNADADAIAQGTGQLVICSSKSNQRSWESTEYPNSVFTRCLIKSLRKNGEATTLGEAFQSLEEMVHDEVQRDRGQQQTPVLKSRWEGSALRMSVPPSRPHAALVQ